MLSIREITTQQIVVNKTNHAIYWIVFYLVDSIINLSNNLGQVVCLNMALLQMFTIQLSPCIIDFHLFVSDSYLLIDKAFVFM